MDCDDGDACTVDSCDPATGCVHEDVVCDDGDVCTGIETCDPATGCVDGTPLDCDDGDLCTNDSCDPVTGCQYADVDCDDGIDCTIDSCDPATGCQHTPDDALCDDNNVCTEDRCDPETGCEYDAIDCDDDNACTVDSCDPELGCQYADVDCDDDDVCTLDTCDPATGCIHTWICNPAIDVEKVADVETYNSVGDVITYTITVTNTGEVDLHDVVVTDAMTGMNETIAVFEVGASQTFTTTYVITEADIDADQVDNVVTVVGTTPDDQQVTDSSECMVPRETSCCEDFNILNLSNIFLGALALLVLLLLTLLLGGGDIAEKFPLPL